MAIAREFALYPAMRSIAGSVVVRGEEGEAPAMNSTHVRLGTNLVWIDTSGAGDETRSPLFERLGGDAAGALSTGARGYTLAGPARADLAVLVLGAERGLTLEARRQILLLSLFEVRQVVVAVDDMELCNYDQAVFERVAQEYRRFAAQLGVGAAACVPVSARSGDNVLAPSTEMRWHVGPTLLAALDAVEIDGARLLEQPLRLPVEAVGHPALGGSGLAGTLVAGCLGTGDAVRVQPSNRVSRVARIVAADGGGDLSEARAGQAVAVALEDDVEVAPGDLLAGAAAPAEVANQFEAAVVWTGAAPLLRGRSYLMRRGPTAVAATVAPLKYKINPATLERGAAATLAAGEIGVCNLELSRPIPFDPYAVNRDTGGFLLLDRLTGKTVGRGMLRFALRRAQNVHWQALDVNKGAAPPPRVKDRASSGTRGYRGPASRPSPIWSTTSCTAWGATPTCWTATTCATA